MTNDDEVDAVIEVYDQYYDNYNLVYFDCDSIRHFLQNLGLFEVKRAMAIACKKRPPRDVFKYFCGICWNKIKQGEGNVFDWTEIKKVAGG